MRAVPQGAVVEAAAEALAEAGVLKGFEGTAVISVAFVVVVLQTVI